MKYQQVLSTRGDFSRNAEQDVGYVAKHSVPVGKVLARQMLRAPSSWGARMTGKALVESAKCDVVQVRNVSCIPV